MFKNIDKEKNLILKNLIEYNQNQVSSKTLSQNPNVSVTLFSFDESEEISSHKSNGDAMVTILEGEAKITIGDNEYILKEGETIVMPKGIPHALFALKKFKMILIVVF